MPLALDTGLALTEEIAAYMSVKFQLAIHNREHPVPIPDGWDANILFECHLALDILTKAYNNRKVTSWSANHYVAELTERASGRNRRVEEHLQNKFPPICSPTEYVFDPCIVVDSDGNILLWYLPGALTKERQDGMWNDLKIVEKSLRINKTSTSWRIKPTFYRAKPVWLKPGTASFSPAWFQQAHEKTNRLEVSAELMKDRSVAWLRTQVRALAVVGGILSIIHPELFSAGIATLKRLHTERSRVNKGERLAEILLLWSSPFTVITVISNRETPYHRDNGSAHPWFDMLAALGEYCNGRMELSGLGLRLKYDPGTIVGIAGRVLRHGVSCSGNRACLAYHMKSKVVDSLGIPSPSWINESFYSV